MPAPRYRSAYAIALAFAAFALTHDTHDARAQQAKTPESDVKASMQCERASEPGRVRCSVETRIEGGRTLAWADVEILSLPDFAAALKGRIGPTDAVAHDATGTKWALALVAKRSGQGDVRARVRVVACDAGKTPPRCAPVTVDVKATVTVGG